MRNLSTKQLNEIMNSNDYILLRNSETNKLIGINCKITSLKKLKKIKKDHSETCYISYKKCNFMEYISKKVPFIVPVIFSLIMLLGCGVQKKQTKEPIKKAEPVLHWDY